MTGKAALARRLVELIAERYRRARPDSELKTQRLR